MANIEESQLAFQTKITEIIQSKICIYCFKQLKRKDAFSNVLRCSGARCRKLKSYSTIFSMKPFFDSKIRFNKIIEIIHLFFLDLKIKQIKELTNTSKSCIRGIVESVLFIIKKFMKKNKCMIGGENVIVECDESLFGKRKYNRGRMRKPIWVVGFVERTNARKIVLCTVKKRNKKTLSNIINKYVDNRSTLYTDCWPGYFDACDYVREHLTVNHTLGFINHVTGVHTNTIEGNWSAIKALIPRRYRNKKYLSTWLQYFMFRRNYNGNCMLNFINLLH